MGARSHGLILALLLALASATASAADPVQGREWQAVSPPRPAPRNEVQVIEFFSYGCPYCFELEPHLARWAAQKPADVRLVHVPAFRTSSPAYAQLYYTLEALGALDKLHDDVYHAVHRDNLDMKDLPTLLGWAEKQGLDRARFETVYRAAETSAKATRAQETTIEYDVRRTPWIVVDGRYATSTSMAGSPLRAIEVIQYLVNKARAERKATR